MSRYSFSTLLGVLMLLCSTAAHAQEEAKTVRQKPLKAWQEQRLHADYTGWKRALPSSLKAQYAGGMGIASVGISWDYGRSNQFETDFHFGFLPRRYSDRNHAVFTLKQNWMPWNIRCTDWLGIEPFSCGLYLTTITGPRAIYWRSEPSKYGGPYYRFATRVRAYLYAGQRATWYVQRPDATFKQVTLYYELSVKELDAIAKFTNKDLSLSDIFYFSVGVKLGFEL